MREITIKKLSETIRNKFYNGKKNLDLAEKNHKRSYFDLKQKQIVFEILTSNDNFRLKNVFYNIYENQPYIVIHVSDCTKNITRGHLPLYLTKITESINNIQSCSTTPISIPEESELNVVVFNSTNEIYCEILENIIKNHIYGQSQKIVQPDESGGGVIVKGP